MFKGFGAGTMAPAEDLGNRTGYLGNLTGAATLKIMMKIDHERCCTAITTVVLIDDDATLS